MIKIQAIIKAVLLIGVSAGLASCEKVIDVDLKSTEKKFVIEANLSNKVGGCTVLVSKTKDFNESNSFAGISGAVVTITEKGGPVTVLAPGTAGVYSSGFTGTSGKQYDLLVTVEGQTFSATCTMPAPVNLDSIYVTDEFLFDESKLIVNVEFMDPPGRGNNYRFIQYFNGKREPQLQFMNDDYTDGRTVNSKLFYFDDDDENEMKLKSGDEVTVEMYCIDPAMYRYWFSLFRSSTGDSNQATPSNPVTNMKGGALGYFSAHTIQTRSMIVP